MIRSYPQLDRRTRTDLAGWFVTHSLSQRVVWPDRGNVIPLDPVSSRSLTFSARGKWAKSAEKGGSEPCSSFSEGPNLRYTFRSGTRPRAFADFGRSGARPKHVSSRARVATRESAHDL